MIRTIRMFRSDRKPCVRFVCGRRWNPLTPAPSSPAAISGAHSRSFALAHPMQSSASVRPLVTSIGRAELLPPRSLPAQWAAVALPAIATAADAENGATATAVTVSEQTFGHDHPGSHATPIADDG